jgi:thiamine-phosphate pyrophosphorylase
MKTLADCRLYTFIDTAYLGERSATEVAQMLCDGGSDIIQLRAKSKPRDEVRRLASAVKTVTDRSGVPLVVNDHWPAAIEIGAAFCHLGQEDFFGAGFRHAQDLGSCGGATRLGLSTHAPDQAEQGVQAGAAYLGVGPVYATATKPGAPPVTLAYVRWAASHLRLPWFAIGGINPQNLEDVLHAGASRICVVSAILNAPNIVKACQSFREYLTSKP